MSDLKHLEQSNLDFHKVKPLNSNRLVTFVNHFIVSIVEQLNELSSCVDSRLHKLNNQINICHSNLVILEMKLNSISGLTSLPLNDNAINHNMNNTSESQQTQQINNISVDNKQEIEENNISTEEVIQTDTQTSNEVEESEPIEDVEEEVVEEVEEDPQMARYKKMLKMGIPLGAVHQKMLTEGVDITLLKV